MIRRRLSSYLYLLFIIMWNSFLSRNPHTVKFCRVGCVKHKVYTTDVFIKPTKRSCGIMFPFFGIACRTDGAAGILFFERFVLCEPARRGGCGQNKNKNFGNWNFRLLHEFFLEQNSMVYTKLKLAHDFRYSVTTRLHAISIQWCGTTDCSQRGGAWLWHQSLCSTHSCQSNHIVSYGFWGYVS